MSTSARPTPCRDDCDDGLSAVLIKQHRPSNYRLAGRADVSHRATIRGMDVRFEVRDPAVEPASGLIAAVLAEYDAEAGLALRGGPSATSSDFSPPGGAYLVGFVGDTAVCGAGIKAFAPRIAELKRLYVAQAFRGRGLGAAMLNALERAAGRLGYEAVRIDCQHPNWPMYLAAGYREIADYNRNPHADIWGEKEL